MPGATRATSATNPPRLTLNEKPMSSAARGRKKSSWWWADHLRREAAEHPLDEAVGVGAAGDAAEEHVDVAVADLVVDEVGAALVVDRRARHLDGNAPDLAAAVGACRGGRASHQVSSPSLGTPGRTAAWNGGSA